MIPNFFIVGSAKAGTSALDHFLSLHPDISMSRLKESHYFARTEMPLAYTGPGDDVIIRYMTRTLEEYEALFLDTKPGQVVGESSVYYLNYELVPALIEKSVPDAKIIIMLRNPMDRAYSAYMHLVRDGRENNSFEEGLRLEPERKRDGYEPIWWYCELGMYSESIKRYYNIFGESNVKVIFYDDFKSNIQNVLFETFEFLGVNPEASIDTNTALNVSGVPASRTLYDLAIKPNLLKKLFKPFLPARLRVKLVSSLRDSIPLRKVPIHPETYQMLAGIYRPEILTLQDMFGRDLSGWSTRYI